MAAIEYSYFETFVSAGTGGTGNLYFPIGNVAQPNGTISILKYMTLVSSAGIGDAGTAFNYILYSSDDDIGTNLIPMTCAPQSAVGSNTVIKLIDQGQSYVTNQPYLALDVNTQAAGSFYVFYSYLQFPPTNSINNNFNVFSGDTIGGQEVILSQQANTTIVQSASVVNRTGGPLNFFFTYSGQNISDDVTLQSFESAFENVPIYCAGTNSGFPVTNFGITASAGLDYYVSTLTNQQE